MSGLTSGVRLTDDECGAVWDARQEGSDGALYAVVERIVAAREAEALRAAAHALRAAGPPLTDSARAAVRGWLNARAADTTEPTP